MEHRIFSLKPADDTGCWQPVEQARIGRAKRAFSTRRVDISLAAGLAVANVRPTAGQIVLAQVDRLGQHKRLEDVNGRRVTLYPGDEILVAYGDRYATDQYHAHVPETLGSCHLVAAGGIAAVAQDKSAKVRGATELTPIGVVTDASGEPLSTQAFACADAGPNAARGRPTIVGVVGSSMNAGKTTTIASLIHGECKAGRRVGAVKVTGTGSGGDMWAYADAGADATLDFTDAGYPSTYRLAAETHVQILELLLRRMRGLGMETVFVEVADGLLFGETAALICSSAFRQSVDGVIFAASDAMGAISGARWLAEQRWPLLAVSGAMTASPLAIEEVRPHIEAPILTLEDMLSGAFLASEDIARRYAA